MKEAIPKGCMKPVEENLQNTQNMTLRRLQEIVLADQKGCRTIRDFIQIKTIQTHWNNKWTNALSEDITDPEWTYVYKSLWKQRISPNMIYFPNQVITKTLMTNNKKYCN